MVKKFLCMPQLVQNSIRTFGPAVLSCVSGAISPAPRGFIGSLATSASCCRHKEEKK